MMGIFEMDNKIVHFSRVMSKGSLTLQIGLGSLRDFRSQMTPCTRMIAMVNCQP